jgi:hypothetical protein
MNILDIIEAMIEWNLIDHSRLYDTDYVAERVATYIKARNFVHEKTLLTDCQKFSIFVI